MWIKRAVAYTTGSAHAVDDILCYVKPGDPPNNKEDSITERIATTNHTMVPSGDWSPRKLKVVYANLQLVLS